MCIRDSRNTRLCDWYENGKITVCSKEEYFERVITFLEQIPETVAVERMFSRIPEKDAVFCNWGCSWWRLRDEPVSYTHLDVYKRQVYDTQ